MPATSEILVEELRELEDAILSARSTGADVSELEKRAADLRKRVVEAVEALNEGKRLLKD